MYSLISENYLNFEDIIESPLYGDNKYYYNNNVMQIEDPLLIVKFLFIDYDPQIPQSGVIFKDINAKLFLQNNKIVEREIYAFKFQEPQCNKQDLDNNMKIIYDDVMLQYPLKDKTNQFYMLHKKLNNAKLNLNTGGHLPYTNNGLSKNKSILLMNIYEKGTLFDYKKGINSYIHELLLKCADTETQTPYIQLMSHKLISITPHGQQKNMGNDVFCLRYEQSRNKGEIFYLSLGTYVGISETSKNSNIWRKTKILRIVFDENNNYHIYPDLDNKSLFDKFSNLSSDTNLSAHEIKKLDKIYQFINNKNYTKPRVSNNEIKEYWNIFGKLMHDGAYFRRRK